MAREQNRPRPHRIKHEERAAFMPCDLKTLEKGDVFIRSGTPHMVVDPPSELQRDALAAGREGYEGKTWIVNLQSGGCWPVSSSEQVHPAYDVKLAFATGRREY